MTFIAMITFFNKKYENNIPITFFASFELGESPPVGFEDKELVAVPLGVCVSSSSEPLCDVDGWERVVVTEKTGKKQKRNRKKCASQRGEKMVDSQSVKRNSFKHAEGKDTCRPIPNV